jgi:hypothetical protein
MTSETQTGDCAQTCQAIGAATTEGEVVAAVRRYLGSLEHHKLAALPATLLSLQVNHAADIAAAAVDLARHETNLLQHGPEASLLKDVSTVLSTAAMRLAIISMEPSASPT